MVVAGVFDDGAQGVHIAGQVIVGFAAQPADPRLVDGGLALDLGDLGAGLDQVVADGVQAGDQDEGGVELFVQDSFAVGALVGVFSHMGAPFSGVFTNWAMKTVW